MSNPRIDDVLLPQISPAATDWDRQLLQALYDQWRDTNHRLWALETTLGNVSRKVGAINTIPATITSYNGVPTVSGGIPSIIALDTHVGLTAALGSTAAFTLPAVDGWYEVSVYLTMTTVAATGTIATLLSWTDADSNTATAATVALQTVATTLGWSEASGTNSFKSALIRAKASTAINVSTVFTAITGSPVYNVYVMVKKL